MQKTKHVKTSADLIKHFFKLHFLEITDLPGYMFKQNRIIIIKIK